LEQFQRESELDDDEIASLQAQLRDARAGEQTLDNDVQVLRAELDQSVAVNAGLNEKVVFFWLLGEMENA
jgi:hypothetical protein